MATGDDSKGTGPPTDSKAKEAKAAPGAGAGETGDLKDASFLLVPKERDSPRWDAFPRKRPAHGKALSVSITCVLIKHKQIDKLKEALLDGGGLTAKRTVGDFQKGFKLLAGKDLNLHSFDILGLNEGDELDRSLGGVVQEALSAGRDDERDMRLLAQPPWYKREESEVVISRFRRLGHCLFPCCVKRHAPRFHKKKRIADRFLSCWVVIQRSLMTLFYRSHKAKERDIFLSCQEGDKDIAKWTKTFCESRHLTVHYQLPCDAVREYLSRSSTVVEEKKEPEIKAQETADGAVKAEDEDEDASSQGNDEDHEADGGGLQEKTEGEAHPAVVDLEPKELSNETIELWLQRREHLIKSSRVFVVVADPGAFENAWVLLDCLWAWQWGVPILPVRRQVQDLEPDEVRKSTVESPNAPVVDMLQLLRRKVRFIFSLGLGLPFAGQGANRKDFSLKVTQALARSIRRLRQRKRNRLPGKMWDSFARASKCLEKEAEQLVQSTKKSGVEKALLQEVRALRGSEGQKAVKKSQFQRLLAGERLEDDDDMIGDVQMDNNNPSMNQSMDLIGADAENDEDDEEAKKQKASKREQEQAAALAAQTLESKKRLEPSTEDRIYGMIAMLKSDGVKQLSVAAKATHAIRIITHTERGSITVALFGGIQVLLELAKLGVDLQIESGSQSVSEAREPSANGKRESRNLIAKRLSHQNSTLQQIEAPQRRCRMSCCRRRRSNDDFADDDDGPDDDEAEGSPSGSPSGSPLGSPKLGSPKLGSPKTGLKSARNGSPLGSPKTGLKSAAGAEGKKKDPVNMKLKLACESFAALRNLAAHSVDRKKDIFKFSGEEAATVALSKHRGQPGEQAESLSLSCAALLRNLSEGCEGCVTKLADAGFLEVAQDELEDGEGGAAVRRHVLATLQNMAASISEGTKVFTDTEMWLNLCSKALDKSVEEEDQRTIRQALGAVANFALLRAGVQDEEETQIKIEPTHAKPLMTMAPQTIDGSEEDELDEAKTLVKPESATLDTKDKVGSDHSSSEESSSSDSGSEASGESVAQAAEQNASQSGEEDSSKEEDNLSVPTEAQELAASLVRAKKKVSEDVIQGMLDLAQIPEVAAAGADLVAGPPPAVAASAVAALANFAQDTDIERLIGSMGGVEIVVAAMAYYSKEDFQLQALRFFWNMTFSRANQQRFVDNGGIEKVVALLDRCREPSHASLQEQGCGVLRNLAAGKTGRHKRRLLREGSVPALCKALDRFYKHVNVAKQAVAGLVVICDGAPPAAIQTSQAGGARSLVRALKITGANFKLTEMILQAMECVLIAKQALTSFCMAGGHVEVLKVLSRFYSDTTALRALRTLACALSHTVEPEESQDVAAMFIDDEEDEGEEGDPEKEFQRMMREKMKTTPASQMRAELTENQIVQKVFDAMDTYQHYVFAIEAGAGLLLNLVLEVHSHKVKDDRHIERKHDVGKRCETFLRMIARVAYDPEARHGAAGFAATLLHLLSTVCVDPESALTLYREQAAERTLEYMEVYNDESRVQAAGCVFLGNLATTQPRIREAVVQVGTVQRITELLSIWREDATVVEAACKALKEISATQAAVKEMRGTDVMTHIFDAMDIHEEDAKVMASAYGLLWSLATTPHFNGELIDAGAISKALTVLALHSDSARVVTNSCGLIRNLISPGTDGLRAATECMENHGFRLMLNALWAHSLPPIDEEAPQQAIVTAADQKQADAGTLPMMGKRQHDWKSTYDSTAVAEQVISALRNLSMHGTTAKALADEIHTHQEGDELKMVLEFHPKSAMVQFQGCDLLNRLLAVRRDLKTMFMGIADHVLMMAQRHRKTPVSDIAELVLEAIN